MANIDKNFRVKNGLDVKGTINLAAIAESKSETAVDVFVYDTSKDTDGGAWRHRTQHTSWYNETLNTSTRGSRKEFPAVAMIVAESNKVTIYDGDDPALPMWMVFNGGFKYTIHYAQPITSISMLNGELRVGAAGSGAGNLSEISFLADKSGMHVNSTVYYYIRSALSQRNTSVTTDGAITAGLVNRDVNDVAMTVLPNAPIDPATGLPVPTIAVATAGGVSVIKDDGTVVDITYSIANEGFTSHIRFTDDGGLIFNFSGSVGANNYIYVFDTLPTADNLITVNSKTGSSQNADALYTTRLTKIGNADLALLAGVSNATAQLYALTTSEAGTALGLSNFYTDPTAPANGMVAYTTSTYNTGWMNGDIKGAFLSDTDDTDLTDAELVTNGTFDTDISGWTNISPAAGIVTWDASQRMKIEAIGTGVLNNARYEFSTIPGAVYRCEATLEADASNVVANSARIRPSNATGGDLQVSGNGSAQTIVKYLTATSTIMYLNAAAASTVAFGVAGDIAYFDNISVTLADADRSMNNKPLHISGTITRSPVATGADLVAYSGFSTSNYLEQPYNSDLDFGTGDFCVMGWVKTTATGFQNLVNRRGTTDGLMVTIIPNNKLAFSVKFSNYTEAASTIPVSTWFHFVVARTSGTVALYVNGALSASASRTENVSSDAPSMFVGSQQNGDNPVDGSIALFRISATAPTAAQIKKIYEDEKFLFQENAQATLYGTSDAVTALGHDEDTGLLHVGTSAGRSVFQGLRRVSNTTTAVGTAISASNGLVVEE